MNDAGRHPAVAPTHSVVIGGLEPPTHSVTAQRGNWRDTRSSISLGMTAAQDVTGSYAT